MKIIPIEQLQDIDFAFTDVSVTYRTPPWTTLGNLETHTRSVNGFLLIDKGSCRYEWKNGSADLTSGGLIYLALGSRKRIDVIEKPFSYYNINFTVTDLSDGEQIIFRTDPLVITQAASKNIFDCCNTMLSSTMSKNGVFKSIANLCEIFDTISKHYMENADSRILPAVKYIEDNYTDNIDISYLSSMCYLSQAHFFRLFKNEKGVSPIEYRNVLRINRAKSLLSDNEYSISEIADILGFQSIYYFSRFFKKYTGIRPSDYINKR